MPRHTIRGFIFAVVVVALALALGLMAVVLNGRLRTHLAEAKQAELTRVAADLARLAAREYDPHAGRTQVDAWTKDMGELGGYRVSLIAPDGRLDGDSHLPERELDGVEPHHLRPEVRAAFETGRGQSRRFSATLGREYLYAAARVEYENAPPKVLRVGLPLESLDRAREDLLASYGLVALMGLALALIVVWAGTRRLGRDFRELTETARSLAAGDLGRRPGRRLPPNELGRIGAALNRLADSLTGQSAKTEEHLRHLLTVLEAMDEGVLVLDEGGAVTQANRRLAELLRLPATPAGGPPGLSLRRPELREDFDRIRRGEKPPPRLIHDHGPPETFVEARFSPIQGGGAVAVFHDLTSRHRLYRMRREFVANISHELRTPLTAIMGAAETLRGRLTDESARPILDMLDRQARRLSELARDVLELARLEDVKAQPLARERLSVKDLLAEIPGRAQPGPAASPGRFRLEIEDDALAVTGDRAALTGALANLADNALKYGAPGGEITLRARARRGMVELAVVNQGPPVAPEDRDRVFERFYRGEKSRQSGRGGTGLGLAIVKHVALAHGGRAALDCPPEGGSVFTITLPG